LDPDSEKLVQDVFGRAVANRNTVVNFRKAINHNANRQDLVINEGKIADCGNDKSLIPNGGLYKKLSSMLVV